MKAPIRIMLFLSLCVLLQAPGYAQTTPISVNCTDTRLTASTAAMCESPEFRQLGQQIDELTMDLERRLSGANKEALVDTERPFALERNNCQNERPEVWECVERVLRQRYVALNAALTRPDSIRDELFRYQFLRPPFVLKYGESLVGRSIKVWGCLTLDPGPVTEERLTGSIREACGNPDGLQIPVLFETMDQPGANFIDRRSPYSHHGGIVQRENGRIILRIE